MCDRASLDLGYEDEQVLFIDLMQRIVAKSTNRDTALVCPAVRCGGGELEDDHLSKCGTNV